MWGFLAAFLAVAGASSTPGSVLLAGPVDIQGVPDDVRKELTDDLASAAADASSYDVSPWSEVEKRIAQGRIAIDRGCYSVDCVTAAARSLGANWALLGTVTPKGGGFDVTVSAIAVKSGKVVGAAMGRAENTSRVADSLGKAVSDAFKRSLIPPPVKAPDTPTFTYTRTRTWTPSWTPTFTPTTTEKPTYSYTSTYTPTWTPTRSAVPTDTPTRAPTIGSIFVESELPGLDIVVDGTDTNLKTPATVSGVPFGGHEVKVKWGEQVVQSCRVSVASHVTPAKVLFRKEGSPAITTPEPEETDTPAPRPHLGVFVVGGKDLSVQALSFSGSVAVSGATPADSVSITTAPVVGSTTPVVGGGIVWFPASFLSLEVGVLQNPLPEIRYRVTAHETGAPATAADTVGTVNLTSEGGRALLDLVLPFSRMLAIHIGGGMTYLRFTAKSATPGGDPSTILAMNLSSSPNTRVTATLDQGKDVMLPMARAALELRLGDLWSLQVGGYAYVGDYTREMTVIVTQNGVAQPAQTLHLLDIHGPITGAEALLSIHF